MLKQKLLLGVVLSLLAGSGGALAAVSAEEAAKLRTTLTPLGAERAGNADGTIPEWKGVTADPAAQNANFPPDPFPQDKPSLQITGQNAAKYGDKLSDGVKALLAKFPSFRLDVYPTRRTASAPQAVYDNTFKNATQAQLDQGGQTVKGAYGGTPFPIPSEGLHVIWNHILHGRPASSEYGFKNLVGTSDGRQTVASRADNNNQSPYYYLDGSAANWTGDYLLARFQTTDPPFKSGESLVIRDSVDPANTRQAWQYLVGQRRVRRAPTVAYDTPDFVASGANYFDEVNGLYGAPDRFQWKLVGKTEMYIPYNNNRFFLSGPEEAFVPYHANPDKMRWELHRVWVVDATVAPGKRHAVPKRRYYFDEDTWAIALVDGFDSDGKLWRTSQVVPFVAPAIPLVVADTTIVYNLQASTYSCVQCFNGEAWRPAPVKSDSFFTGDSLGSEGVR